MSGLPRAAPPDGAGVRGADDHRQDGAGAGPPPAAAQPRLCVGMATYDDFDGVWFTIQALRMGHPDLADSLSFLVVDNHPEGPVSSALEEIGSHIPRYRYVPFSGFRGTAVRDLVFREADAEVVCCLDSHVLVRPGGLSALLAWFEEHPGSRDLVQGPLWYDDLGDGVATHLAPRWGAGMFGQWDLCERGRDPAAPPFPIGMQGLGLFACRRDAWPGLNPRFRGFGGEEGYLHEKFRRAGGQVLCHPGVRWAHRFQRPAGVPYSNVWEDRVRNYLIGWTELGWDTTDLEAHFRAHIANDEATTALLARAWKQARSPLGSFDAIFCPAGLAAQVLPQADVSWRVEEVDLPHGLPDLEGRTGLWRHALTEARRRGYASVLVVEAPCDVDERRLAEAGVDSLPWDVLELVVAGAADDPPATAVRADVYDRLLAHLGEADAGGGCRSPRSVAGSCGGECCAGRPSLQRVRVPVVPPQEPDRPRRAPGLQISEVADGLLVTEPRSGAVCHLNQTAALVLQLSWGLLTSRQIARVLADEFSLAEAPVEEVEQAVDTLRGISLVE